MRHGRTLNKRIPRLRERFRIIYNEKNSFFQFFFDRDRSVSIQTGNLQIFSNEIFKDSKGIALDVLANILISMTPVNFSPYYQSGFQLKPDKIGI